MRKVIARTAISVASAAALGIAGAPTAFANPSTASFGGELEVTDGAVVTEYTVEQPQASSDVIDVPIAGQLYEAEVTVEAERGSSTPSIPFFNARTSGGENYRVLWQAYAPEGLSGATLLEDDEASGKIYFDVTGPAPTMVVYNDAVQDRLIWQ